MKKARPIARGCTRFSDGPPSAMACTTRRSSRLRTWWLCSAFATAERSTFSMRRAAARGVYSRVARASPTDLPRIWSRTRRAFRAETRTNRARALVITGLRLPRRGGGGLLGLAVRLERARERELAEPVADHVLGHVDGNELLAVVHGQRVAHELRRDRRPPRPRLEDLLLAGAVELLDPPVQLLVDEGSLLERTSHAPLLFLSPRHDHGIRRTGAPARLVTLRRLAPWGHRVVALALALAPAHRVVDGVHHGAAHRRTKPLPAHAPGLADRHVLVVEVADLADGRHALEGDVAHLARGQLDGGPVALLGEQLRLRARAPAQLRAPTLLQLDVVHEGADGDVPDGQRVARQDVRLRAGHHDLVHLEAVRRDDVALLAVAVVQQRQPRRAIRVVLDRRHPRRDAELFAPEVHVAQHPLGPAPAMADGDPAVDVAPVRAPLGREQALLRLLLRDLFVRDVREIAARRRRRLDGSDAHGWLYAPSMSSILWPGWSVTMAFFQSGRRPAKRPIRLSLPSYDAVRTAATFTLNTA